MHCHLGVSSLKLTPSMETKLGAESDHGDSSTHQCPIPVRHTLGHTNANKFQQTFLIVTHNEELAKMGDRVVMMKDGRII